MEEVKGLGAALGEWMNIAIKSQNEKNKLDGDYISDDGYLYCGKCNTRKEEEIDWIDGSKQKVPTNCQCKEEAEIKERDTKKKRKLHDKIKKLQRNGLTQTKYREFTFEKDKNYNKEVTKLCKKYVENFSEMKKTNTGLALLGRQGRGKSYYAGCIVNALINKGISAMMTELSVLVEKMKENFDENKEKILNQLDTIDLLVLDDVGKEKTYEYLKPYVFEVINRRYLIKKPVIITTNKTFRELREEDNEYLSPAYNRLVELCTPIEIKGEDIRELIAKEKRKEVFELLKENK